MKSFRCVWIYWGHRAAFLMSCLYADLGMQRPYVRKGGRRDDKKKIDIALTSVNQ